MIVNPDGASSKLTKIRYECGKCGSSIMLDRNQLVALANGKQVGHSCVGTTLFHPCYEQV